MRNPVRSEAEAFSFVIAVGLLALAVGIAAWLGGGWVALGVLLGVGLGVGVGIFLQSEPKTREAPIWERKTAGRRRILVIANETCVGKALREEIRYRARGSEAEVIVIAPALSSNARHKTAEVDTGRGAAQGRLDASLSVLAGPTVRVRGELGDADPLQAIADGLRTFEADEIIISTHPPGRSTWLERDVVSRARELYDLPVTHVVVDLEAERVASP